MAPKFGTSGLRGLVTELTEPLVCDYTRAFLAACPHEGRVFVGQDLRPSSPRIAKWVREEILAHGLEAIDCGALPTPALALASMQAGAAAVMVTGSHIPSDRNGLKFYVPSGEISKQDETGIQAELGRSPVSGPPGKERHMDASAAYAARYREAFGPALEGLTIGVYQHSSVARDLMVEVMEGLGARAVAIARSDIFIPVDTEALDPGTKQLFAGWFEAHGLDVLISTDGDADRPMMVDDACRVVPGDVLGAITARQLGADTICTPVSSNTMVDKGFGQVIRTRIGSPYVIAAMEEVISENSSARIVGYEANGGFLLGFEAETVEGKLAPLVTRDCFLPIIAPLVAARSADQSMSQLIDTLPPRFTAADRIQGIETSISKAFIAAMSSSVGDRAAFFESLGPETGLDLTDGLRVSFQGEEIVHLRPSGNAPEFRCYAEAGSQERAAVLVETFLAKLEQETGAGRAGAVPRPQEW
ncbi:phosphomannomutase [Aliiruegeria sabulilitoris]|uniref:phosphomannomutase n=1 Tax=Aliiruegeria sabulilitoris TaxID=1510458 RepID=UPI00082B6860|nr:phosphomannomutase [Aliiruegeria sabulilitoris]NDR59753.1 phosphomannomutase [Pseudoruegeria sp. M32A2M]